MKQFEIYFQIKNTYPMWQKRFPEITGCLNLVIIIALVNK